MIEVVLPSQNGLLCGFFVCYSSKNTICIDLVLHVYNLAHFERRCVICTNIDKLYEEYQRDINVINDLITKFKLG
jgi:hypothetical protein